MPPHTAPPLGNERAELLHLAQAFDGIVGAIHEGQRVARDELEQAARAASMLWDAKGPEWHAADLKEAQAEMLANAPAVGQGDIQASIHVERAAHRIAQDLRWRAHAVSDHAEGVAFECRNLVQRLDARFARFAIHPQIVPM